MKKSLALVMSLVLLVISIIPGVSPASLPAASAYAPTPRPIPDEYLSGVSASTNEIVFIPGTVDIDQDAANALRQALLNAHGTIPPAAYYSLSDIRVAGDWYFVSVVCLNDVDPDLAWYLDNAIWIGLALLHDRGEGHWSGAMEGTPEFSLLLAEVPESVLNATARSYLDPNSGTQTVTSAYRFPWQEGTTMQYGVYGVHNAGFYTGWKAVDFLSDGNTGAGHAPNRLLAAASGSISYVCRDGTSVAIRIGDLLYAHLLDNGNLTVGHYFNEGDEIGQLRTGSFSGANCGWADQGAGWFHVHWGFPDTGTFEAGGWTLSLADGLWRRDAETKGIYDWFLAEGGGDTTPPDGDYTSPTNGATITSRTVRMAAWATDNSSGVRWVRFNAKWSGEWRTVYEDSSSPYEFDWDLCNSGVPDGDIELSLHIQDNAGNEFFLSDKHANPHITKSYDCSPSCSPNADQIALYVDSNYFGQCVVKGIGEYSNPSAIGLPNDSINSVKVGGNVKAVLCRDDNYGGTCETFYGDDPDLGNNGIGNDQVSSAKVQPRALPPSAPTLQSPANGSTFNEGQAITLSWSDTGDEYYGEVWGGPAGTTPFGWQTGTSKYIGSQWAGYTYSWHVKARNSAGESGWSSTWTFTVRPAAPSNLSAEAVSCSEVNLSWSDNSGNEEGYKVYRNGTYIAQVGANVTSYQDTGLSENSTYSYYVKAYRGSIESAASNTADATTPACACPTITDWKGEYWSNPDLSGSRILCRNDFSLDFDWALGSPDPSVPDNGFSARWTRVWEFPAGTYRFFMRHDDGARLYIDDVLKLDRWGTCCVWDAVDVTLASGSHTVRMELYEDGGVANAALWWERLDISGWRGEYYNNDSLADHPILVRDDGQDINFEWSVDSPDPLVQSDHFSVRWTRSLWFASGTYRFDLFHDDGARLYVDGAPVFENWCDDCRLWESVTVPLSEGVHSIKLETFENSGWAAAKLTYCSAPVVPALISPGNGSSTCDTTPTLDWSAVSGATSYHIQVDNNSDFSSPEIDALTTSLDYTPGTALAPSTYYWRVHAANYCSDSSWSAIRHFHVSADCVHIYLPAILRNH